jgi:hypothetical protein
MRVPQFQVDGKADDGSNGDNCSKDRQFFQFRREDRVNYIGCNQELEPKQEIVAKSMAKHIAIIQRIVSPKTPAFNSYQCHKSDTDSPKDDGYTDNPDSQTNVFEEFQTTPLPNRN